MREVCVIGSINADIVYRTACLPQVGETVNATMKDRFPGGKGYNQAVAASKVHPKVRLIGAVGGDPSGDYIRSTFEACEVDTSGVITMNNGPTGEAIIFVGESGDNMIMVSGGVNRRLTKELLPKIENSIILVQLEIPLDLVYHIVENKGDNLVVMNMAPYREIPLSILQQVDVLVMNSVEARQLVKSEETNPQKLMAQVRKMLSAPVIVITLGGDGVIYMEEEFTHVESHPVIPVDTTGAGDAFTGILAGLLPSMALKQAVDIANRGAALSTLKMGAQSAMPTMKEISELGGKEE